MVQTTLLTTTYMMEDISKFSCVIHHLLSFRAPLHHFLFFIMTTSCNMKNLSDPVTTPSSVAASHCFSCRDNFAMSHLPIVADPCTWNIFWPPCLPAGPMHLLELLKKLSRAPA